MCLRIAVCATPVQCFIHIFIVCSWLDSLAESEAVFSAELEDDLLTCSLDSC